jgi:phosphomannomutase
MARENPVQFGTDGWRALIADKFTFENVIACAQATANHLAPRRSRGAVVVGYDTRFLSDEFASLVARVFAASGFAVQRADRPAPTPAISWRIREAKAIGGVIITSSHNPANWNGFKVKSSLGSSAGPKTVAAIERRIPRILAGAPPALARATDPAITRFDPLPGFLEGVAKQVNLKRIRAAGFRVAIDPMFGAGQGLFERLLDGGRTAITAIHSERNPAFPGLRAPEPIDSNLGGLMALVAGGMFDVGIANDGDADRLGLVDETGVYVDQLRTFAILINYLYGERKKRGAVVKSVTTTDMARLLAEHYGQPCEETPVGFKFIGPRMREVNALIGG